jgi:hypothetical protein
MVAIHRVKSSYMLLWPLAVISFFTATTANGQQLTPSSARINFGTFQTGSFKTQTETLTNGATSVTISAISVTGTAFTLSALPSIPLTLSAGQSTTFVVTFAPTAVGTFSESVTVTAGSTTLSIPLSGAVQQGKLSFRSQSISFPGLQVLTSLTQTGVLLNNGGTPVTIKSVSVQNPKDNPAFSVSTPSSGQTVPAGGHADLGVTFLPTSIGSATGTITVTTDGAGSPLTIALSGTSDDVKSLPQCSLSKTNNACKVIIDRMNPVAPSTVQMYSNQTLFTIVKNPKFYERYFLDYQTGQATLSPDVASSIVQGLLPNLGKFGGLAIVGPPPSGPDPCTSPDITLTPQALHVSDLVLPFQKCLAQLATKAIEIYKGLEPAITPDSLTPFRTAEDIDTQKIQIQIQEFVSSEVMVSSRISAISSNTILKSSDPDGPAIQQLSDLQKMADAVASDLLNFNQRLDDLKDFHNGSQDCANLIHSKPKEPTDHVQCVYIVTHPDRDRVYQGMVTKTFTYALDTLNLVSNSQQAATDPTKKKSLATIAINFADRPTNFPGSPFTALRWEASAGVFFSMLPNRSFSVAPDGTIQDHSPGPTPLPFAAANYRLTGDLPGRWKSNIYWTAAIGINPNIPTAEYATGFSFAWRALMLSGLCHFGHDIHLTDGVTATTNLGAGFTGTVPTKSYWTEAFAFGVSVRIPSLTGR